MRTPDEGRTRPQYVRWIASGLLVAFLICCGGMTLLGVFVAHRLGDALNHIGQDVADKALKALEEKLEDERWEWHPIVTASDFMTKLLYGNIDGAYRHVSDSSKSQMSLCEFTNFVANNRFLMELSKDFSPGEERGDFCAIRVTVEIEGEGEYTYWLLLRRHPAVFNFGQVYNHPGAWKIDEVFLP